MAMLHADDFAFATQEVVSESAISALFTECLGLTPTHIAVSASQGAFHKVYFLSLEDNTDADNPWSGKDVVLARTIEKVKTENEMALLRNLRAAGIPVPDVVFFDADANNPLKYEYNCLECMHVPSNICEGQDKKIYFLDSVLNQLVDIFIKMWTIDVPQMHGSLRLDGTSGPVIKETMWTLPDITRYFHAPPYNLTSETFGSLNPTNSYMSWPASALDWLRDLLPPLQRVITILTVGEAPWVQRLRDAPELCACLIKAVIDWEFAGIGPSFASRVSPLHNLLGYLRSLPATSRPPNTQELIDTWEAKFTSCLAAQAPEIAAQWA
ncbi:hypothetical protein B0H14DRAFT_2923467 [Mycena olivaceomarginata]|nr:hypothetical protein B0H14DRAFT_2923467 [Mycena olivaceomarginata]